MGFLVDFVFLVGEQEFKLAEPLVAKLLVCVSTSHPVIWIV